MITLSRRLAAVAQQVPPGSCVADIGSDHALLPVYLVERGIAAAAIAGEVVQGPYEAALAQVQQSGLTDSIAVRRGDGLQVVQAGEVDAITIAGMGGNLIVRILTNGLEKLDGVHTLVLQPNVGESFVRAWLVEQDWLLSDEAIIEEDGHFYEVLTAKRDVRARIENEQLYVSRSIENGITVSRELLLRMGPYLLNQPTPALRRKWESELRKLENIRLQLERSSSPESSRKRRTIDQEILSIKEVVTCMPRDSSSPS